MSIRLFNCRYSIGCCRPGITFLAFACMFGAGIRSSAQRPTRPKPSKSAALELVSQRPVTEKDLPCIPKDSDIHFVPGKGDDLLVRFRLINYGDKGLYYLASVHDHAPTGYLLYRNDGAARWESTMPDRGHEGSRTGGGYEWRLLKTGDSVEVEFSDLSTRPGDHGASVLVNYKPVHRDRVEIISESYRPQKILKPPPDPRPCTTNNEGATKGLESIAPSRTVSRLTMAMSSG